MDGKGMEVLAALTELANEADRMEANRARKWKLDGQGHGQHVD